MTLEKEIEYTKKAIEEKQKELHFLIELQKSYPDARVAPGKGEKKFSSKQVNEKITDYFFAHSCSCCNNPSLLVYCFINTPLGRVFSDPASFAIGREEGFAWEWEYRTYTYGDYPLENWQVGLRNAKIPESIIEDMSKHFELLKKEEE